MIQSISECLALPGALADEDMYSSAPLLRKDLKSFGQKVIQEENNLERKWDSWEKLKEQQVQRL